MSLNTIVRRCCVCAKQNKGTCRYRPRTRTERPNRYACGMHSNAMSGEREELRAHIFTRSSARRRAASRRPSAGDTRASTTSRRTSGSRGSSSRTCRTSRTRSGRGTATRARDPRAPGAATLLTSCMRRRRPLRSAAGSRRCARVSVGPRRRARWGSSQTQSKSRWTECGRWTGGRGTGAGRCRHRLAQRRGRSGRASRNANAGGCGTGTGEQVTRDVACARRTGGARGDGDPFRNARKTAG